MAMAIWPTSTRVESPSRHHARSGARDLEQREVGIRIVADDLRGRVAAVGQRHLDRLGVPGNVAVGQHESVWRDEEARSRSLPLRAAAAPLADLHVRDRRRDARDGAGHRARVRVVQRTIGHFRRGARERRARSVECHRCRRNRGEGHATADGAARPRFQGAVNTAAQPGRSRWDRPVATRRSRPSGRTR